MSCLHAGAWPRCPHCDAVDAPEADSDVQEDVITRVLEGKDALDYLYEAPPETLHGRPDMSDPILIAIMQGDEAQLGKLMMRVFREYILDKNETLAAEIAESYLENERHNAECGEFA